MSGGLIIMLVVVVDDDVTVYLRFVGQRCVSTNAIHLSKHIGYLNLL